MAEPFEFTAPDYDPTAPPEPWEIAEDAKQAWMEGRAPAFNDPDDLDQEEPHFCESPSCMRFPGCAAYRHDSHAAGYWGPGEEEAERAGWDDELDRQTGRSDDEPDYGGVFDGFTVTSDADPGL